jgi:FkbM family methyltransferase
MCVKVHLFAVFCIEIALCNVVIRPSDHLLSGTDYHRYNPRHSHHDHPHPEPNPSPALLHRIRLPSDVTVDTDYKKDFWGVVDFAPVPKFSIDTHDPVSQDTNLSASVHSGKGPWDVYVWDKLVSLLSAVDPGHPPLFVDVGANLGYFSLAAASLGAHVIAFEPMSRNAQKFSKSILKNRFEFRITLFQNAVWEDGGASVHMDFKTKKQATDSGHEVYGVDFVSTTSLSYVVREDVDVLRIDVGGAESVVMSGAKRLICNFRVKYIIVDFSEVEKQDNGGTVSEMLKFLDSAGYSFADVTSDTHTPNIIFTLKGDRSTCEF